MEATSIAIAEKIQGHFIDLELISGKYDLIQIVFTNKNGVRKLILHEEIQQGVNFVTIDLSYLIKDTYNLVVMNSEQKKLLEERIKL